ncbi:MAG: hypothetical protein KDA53_10225 [Hyphomonas sp.]|nr:hypothetical protein [Hyphomonas sp.]
MSAHLVDRIARMLKEGVSGFLDGLEDGTPHTGTNPLGAIIEEIREALGALVAERHLSGKRLHALHTELEDMDGKAETAVSADRDDLARAVLVRRRSLEAERADLMGRIETINSECDRLSRVIEQLKDEAGRGGALTAAEHEAFRELERLSAGQAPGTKEG